MKQPTFGPIFLAFALFCAMLFIPVQWLYPLINDKKVEDAAASLSTNVFQGLALQKQMLEDDEYLPMYGSSELSRLDVYHPYNYFKVNPEGFTPFLIGRGGTQSFVHFLSFAALGDDLKNRELVFILSPQWFTKEGLDEVHFAPNYSSLQAYDLVFNDKLSVELKKKAAKRLLMFDIVKNDKLLTTMLEGIVYDDVKHIWKARTVQPFGYMYRNILERKDVVMSLFAVDPRNPKIDQDLQSLPLNDLNKRAERTGEAESKTNPYWIEDRYYRKHIADKIGKLKGYKANEAYTESPEYEDLQLILDLLKQQKTKALFISIPVNGPWYDFAGFPKERRQAYYEKVCTVIESSGFPVADLSSHEYNPFFLKDTLHIGWKGWVYVDEALAEFHRKQ